MLAEPGDRRSCWQLAEAAGHATPRRRQALLAGHVWDWKAALASLLLAAARQLGYAWSHWRQRHQARARYHRYQARLRASPA